MLNTKRTDGRPNGGWLHSCSRHCGAELVQIDGFTAPTAAETLREAGAAGPLKTPFLDQQPFPCAKCCNDSPYPPRSEL